MRRERTRGGAPAIVRATVIAALLLSQVAAAAACGEGRTATTSPPPPVRIGAIYDLRGRQAPRDVAALDGARLAVERINAGGGLLGRRVELLERDAQTEPGSIRRAAGSLVAAGCSAIIGLSDAEQVLAAAPVAARAGVPFVTSGATSARLPGEVPDWLFLACCSDNAQAAAGAEYAVTRLDARTAAVVYDKGRGATRALSRYFQRSFRAQGGRVLATAAYEKESEVTQRLAEARKRAADRDARTGAGAAGADVLFVAADPADAATVVRRVRLAGYAQPIIGTDSFDSATLVAIAVRTGGDVCYTTHAAVGISSAGRAVRQFDTSFRTVYGRPPQNSFAGLGYDTIGLVAAAIRRAASATPADVRRALQRTRHYPGVTGTLGYDRGERLPRKTVTVVCVKRRPVVAAEFTPAHVADP